MRFGALLALFPRAPFDGDLRIFKAPTPPAFAVEQVESPLLQLWTEGSEYWHELRSAFLLGKLVGVQVRDAHIHAIYLTNGESPLWSADRGFSRMRGLAIVNPCLL